MITLKKNTRQLFFLFCSSFLVFFFSSCEKENIPQQDSPDGINMSAKKANVKPLRVQIVSNSNGLTFTEYAEDEDVQLSSGWTTFEYTNLTDEVHFFQIYKYPGNQTVEDTKTEVMPAFEESVELAQNGVAFPDFMAPLFSLDPEILEWVLGQTDHGGIGMVSPGETVVTTINLPASNYFIECYMKDPDKTLHAAEANDYKGLAGFSVTEAGNDLEPPRSTLQVKISTNGIEWDDRIRPGKNIFEVQYSQPFGLVEFIYFPDVQLVKLLEGADLNELNNWLALFSENGLVAPAPENMVFLGGSQNMTVGSTAYFEAKLKPGNYAFFSEVPMPQEQGMLKEFTVPGNNSSGR